MPVTLKALSTLPKTSQKFRIDYVGHIRRNPGSQTNHLVDIYLSPLCPGFRGYQNIFSKDAVLSNHQTIYQVSLGEILAFYPGCIIQKGKIIWRPRIANFNQHVDIRANTTCFVKAATKEKNDLSASQFIIPGDRYRLGFALGSNVLCISRARDPYSILIPAMEVVRFYYCSSSKFNQALFSSLTDNLDNLINLKDSRYNPKTRHCRVNLRKNYPDEDGKIVARMLADRHAHKQARKVWEALIKFQHDPRYEYLPIEVGFPFYGETNLQAFGVYLPTPGQHEHQRFLALSLIRCTHPLPFDHLEIDRENNARNDSDDTPEERLKKPKSYPQRPMVREPVDLSDHEEGENDPFSNPSGYLQEENVLLKMNRFPQIDISVTVKPETTHRSGDTTGSQEDKLPDQSTSESTYGKTNASAVNVVPCEGKINENRKKITPELPPGFETFEGISQILESVFRKHVEAIRPILINPQTSRGDLDIQTSCFPTKSGTKKLGWSTIKDDLGHKRPRRLLIHEITLSFGVCYLMYIERKPNSKESFAIYLYANKTRTKMPDDRHAYLLQHLANNAFRRYAKLFESLGLSIEKRKHVSSSYDCAVGILEKIRVMNKQDDKAEPDPSESSPI